jgi:hypothetical protein
MFPLDDVYRGSGSRKSSRTWRYRTHALCLLADDIRPVNSGLCSRLASSCSYSPKWCLTKAFHIVAVNWPPLSWRVKDYRATLAGLIRTRTSVTLSTILGFFFYLPFIFLETNSNTLHTTPLLHLEQLLFTDTTPSKCSSPTSCWALP